jgi:hypothetical protein
MGVSLEQVTDRNLALRYDEVDANTAYLGLSPIGSQHSASVWQIKKLDFTTGVDIKWADGNQGFDNVWDNRASLTYI